MIYVREKISLNKFRIIICSTYFERRAGLMEEEDLKQQITSLEEKKKALIDRIIELNKRIRYKKYEQKSLEPFLEKTKDVIIGPLRKQKRAMEFRISTAAYTPQIERELLKQMKKIDENLAKVRDVERARRKKVLVAKDLEDAQAEITKIEEELKGIRESLKGFYDKAKISRRPFQRPQGQEGSHAPSAPKDDGISLEDLASFGFSDKKEKEKK